ncbi:unnamed protein product [Ostreobium quekettii]|uniref:Serine protease n=1 Tax=Ostreobium quekettii TaxID=121088 RepID=A0A8S1IZ54_9CHLO|nr:unnamed protein product [Ostreobium quekettii]
MRCIHMRSAHPTARVVAQVLVIAASLCAVRCRKPRAGLQAPADAGNPFPLPSGRPATHGAPAVDSAGEGESWQEGARLSSRSSLAPARASPADDRGPKVQQTQAAGPGDAAPNGLGARLLAQEAGESVGDPEIPASEEARVLDTRYPFSTVGQTGGGCTGALVGRRCYMTAGHCVYDPAEGAAKGGLRFAPGRNGREAWAPHGSFGARGWRVPNRWLTAGDARFDVAIVRLAEPAGEALGYMSLGTDGLEPMANLNIAGYPNDRNESEMWYDYCRHVEFALGERAFVDHSCNTTNGHSGAPMWVFKGDSNFREIRAMHVGGEILTAAEIRDENGVLVRGGRVQERAQAVIMDGALLAELQLIMEDLGC